MIIRQFKPMVDTKHFFIGADQDVLILGEAELYCRIRGYIRSPLKIWNFTWLY